MKDDPKLQIDDSFSSESMYSPKQRRTESASPKFLRIALVILLVLVLVGSILYFVNKQRTGGEASPLESKVAALEQRLAGLEKRITELQGKAIAPGSDPVLVQRVEDLSQKVAALEKQTQPPAESKAKLSPPSKPVVESKAKPSAPQKPVASSEKQYHTVQKGETLYRISKKYNITVEELQKLNNLPPGQALRAGQKLLVSPSR